ncbi:MAG: hypothetical protein V2I97_17840 [Desulfococcaceae bacterium]|nr:hypothetical protein [Desulfococcaceae bacterium]
MGEYYGVLLETVSIQNYIFQSNKLKQNMGASHMIQNEIYGNLLKESMDTVCPGLPDECFHLWEKYPNDTIIEKQPFEVGYIGGGNAFLLFREQKTAEKFVYSWTKKLLLRAPGVTTAVGICPFDLNSFRNCLDELYDTLRKNKAEYIPQTVIPRHGFTAECPDTGFSAEVFNKQQNKYISLAADIKAETAKSGREFFHNLFQDILSDQFRFPDEFEKLGSVRGEDSHMAVVHIDGNRMAERFRQCKTLAEIRSLSVSVHQATLNAFSKMLRTVLDNYGKIMKELGFNPQSRYSEQRPPEDRDDNYKKFLPITPIVIGGDDVTFVCNGKMGIYFSKLFLEAFEKEKVRDGKKLSACAGVAITKVRYPFYRGYQLSEELCSEAKKINKGQSSADNMLSGIDFHVSMGGIFGSLEELRRKYFEYPQIPLGNLLCRPYHLSDREDEKSLYLMLRKTEELKENFPTNKIKELRNVLTLSETACQNFATESAYRGRHLPDIGENVYSKRLFEGNRTIYFDMIELSDFYPRFAMKKGGAK